MIDKDMKKKDLKELTGLSYTTIGKLERGEIVRSDVLDTICVKMKCQLGDITEVTFEEK